MSDPIFLLAGMAAEAVEKTTDYTWLFVGIGSVITALGIAIPLIINAIAKLRAEVTAATLAATTIANEATEKAESVVQKVEQTVEKVSDIHIEAAAGRGRVETELEKANRHIARQELLMMVLLRRADLASGAPGAKEAEDADTPAIAVPPVMVVGDVDNGMVIIGGTRYRITKANGAEPEKK